MCDFAPMLNQVLTIYFRIEMYSFYQISGNTRDQKVKFQSIEQVHTVKLHNGRF